MKVVTMSREVDAADALAVLDGLRAAIVSGRVIAFCAVGIEPDDSTACWSSATRPVTRLRMAGALAHLLHSYVAGEVAN